MARESSGHAERLLSILERRKDGFDDCADAFGAIAERDRESIDQLLTCLDKHLERRSKYSVTAWPAMDRRRAPGAPGGGGDELNGAPANVNICDGRSTPVEAAYRNSTGDW
jgi:hypothetical protein